MSSVCHHGKAPGKSVLNRRASGEEAVFFFVWMLDHQKQVPCLTSLLNHSVMSLLVSISHALVVRSFECFKQSGLDASDQEPGPGLPEGCGMTLVLCVVGVFWLHALTPLNIQAIIAWVARSKIALLPGGCGKVLAKPGGWSSRGAEKSQLKLRIELKWMLTSFKSLR